MPSCCAVAIPYFFVLAMVGFFAGCLANYIAKLLLEIENPSLYRQPWAGWQYVFVGVIMSALFLLLNWRLGFNIDDIAMMFFIFFLVIVCITDFKAKIIPHEVTYPAIILGIIYSTKVREDWLGALAGIGISYILFDFMAFYGLKIYTWLNRPELPLIQQFITKSEQAISSGREQFKPVSSSSSYLSIAPISWARKFTEEKLYQARLYCKGTPLDELEVIGGGDAVLSALIAAWLGWERLILALVAGFVAGAVLGAIYLLFELWKARLIRSIISPVIIGVLCCSLFVTGMLLAMAVFFHQPIINMPYLQLLPVAIVTGSLLGVITAGAKVSRPFPFGPALVIGAIIAVFYRSKT